MRKKTAGNKLDREISLLVAKQSRLIAKLKKDNRRVYDWFISRGIDFNNLHRQAANFTAAAGLLFSLAAQKTEAVDPAFTDPPVHHEEVSPKVKKTDQERAQAIWAKYGQLIRDSAAEYDIDPNLIFATIMIESGGNPQAIRHEPRIKDASYGLGQILYGTARGLGYRGKPEGLYVPEVNIDLIARYHRRNLDRYGHLTAQQLTAAYNTGSPYKKPLAGHLNKFNKWYNRIENLEFDLT